MRATVARTWIAGACLVFAVASVRAKNGTDWLNEAENASNAVANETVTAPQPGPTGPAGPAGNNMAGCAGGGTGAISLLGVQSQMGPSTQGVSPVAKLGPEHPAKKALDDLRRTMGMGSGATEAASKRMSQAAAYEGYLSARASGTAVNGTPVADLMAWVYSGQLEAMARAYAEQQVIAQPYAAVYAAAEAAGRACP